MKKIIIFLFCIISLLLMTNKEKNVVIPKESIRFRIIANSNSNIDQKTKWNINEELIPILSNITKNSTNIKNARYIINANISNIENIVNKYETNNKISFGQNYFPKKEYAGITYEEGNYESLVITLGDGLGDNWWCVMFPPLCLIEAQKDEIDDTTYKSYFKEIINKYF